MHIAVVDSDPTSRQFLGELLGRLRCEVSELDSGTALWQRLRQPRPPLLVWLRWQPAPVAAEKVCRQVRALRGGAPIHIVAVVGADQHEAGLEAVVAGLADDLLVLPLELEEVERRLAVARRHLAVRKRLADAESSLASGMTRDATTGLWNRAATLAFLAREIASGQRSGEPVGVVLLILAGLPARTTPEDHGSSAEPWSEDDAGRREASDAVLVALAQALRTAVRATDWLGRVEEDALLVVLPGCGPARTAAIRDRLGRFAERPLADVEGITVDARSVAVIGHDVAEDVVARLRASPAAS